MSTTFQMLNWRQKFGFVCFFVLLLLLLLKEDNILGFSFSSNIWLIGCGSTTNLVPLLCTSGTLIHKRNSTWNT